MSHDPNSADVSDVLGASGACPTITVGEGPSAKTWKIGWPTQDAKTRLRKLLIGIAEENTIEMNKDLSPAFQMLAMKEFAASGRRGDYKTWGPGWTEVYSTPRGQLAFLMALLQEHHPRITEAEVYELAREKSDELNIAYLCVAPPFLSLLLDDVPNAQMAKPEDFKQYKRDVIEAIMGQKTMAAALRVVASQTPPTPSIPTETK